MREIFTIKPPTVTHEDNSSQLIPSFIYPGELDFFFLLKFFHGRKIKLKIQTFLGGNKSSWFIYEWFFMLSLSSNLMGIQLHLWRDRVTKSIVPIFKEKLYSCSLILKFIVGCEGVTYVTLLHEVVSRNLTGGDRKDMTYSPCKSDWYGMATELSQDVSRSKLSSTPMTVSSLPFKIMIVFPFFFFVSRNVKCTPRTKSFFSLHYLPLPVSIVSLGHILLYPPRPSLPSRSHAFYFSRVAFSTLPCNKMLEIDSCFHRTSASHEPSRRLFDTAGRFLFAAFGDLRPYAPLYQDTSNRQKVKPVNPLESITYGKSEIAKSSNQGPNGIGRLY